MVTSEKEVFEGMSDIKYEGIIFAKLFNKTFHKTDIERLERLIEVMNRESIERDGMKNGTKVFNSLYIQGHLF